MKPNSKMHQIITNLKKKETIIALWFFALPVISCIIKVIVDGASFQSIKMSAMTMNDEVFYFKYIEGLLNYGHPMGFFGFNESKAAIGGGTAWSPLICLHWIVWGALFGWNYLSPLLCNIFVMSLAFLLFALWMKPNYLQTGIFSILYLLYGQASYYSLSGLPENFIYALLIVFIAMAYKVMNKFQMGYINAMIAVIMLLTMMRPYYIVLFLIPIYVLARNERKTACVLSGIGGVAALAGYALISKYLCASYFGTSVVGMGLTPDDFQEGVWEGIKTIIKTLLRGVQMTFYWISTTFSDGSYQGRMLIVLFAFFFAVIILAVQKRKEKVKLVWLGYWIIYFVIRYMAIILLYNRNISDAAIRHMFDFILIGIIIFSMEASKKVFTYIQCFILGAILLVTQYYAPRIAPQLGSNALNYMNEQTYQDIMDVKENIGSYIQIQGNDISYDNTIIWVFKDKKEETIYTDWRYCFALPQGIGLSICYEEYVRDNYHDLQSPYLLTVSGGDIAKLCEQNGALEIYNNDTIVIYNIRDTVKDEQAIETINSNIENDASINSILVLGDSIFGNFRSHFGFCRQLERLLDIEVYNGAVGGSSAAIRENTGIQFQKYSFSRLSKFLLEQNLAFLEQDARELSETHVGYIDETLTVLKSIDYESIDFVVICYGSNDYFSGVPIESNWPQEETTFKAALEKGVQRIKKTFPHAQILLCTPIYGNYMDKSNLTGDSNSYDVGYGTMEAYVQAIEEVAAEQQVGYINAYDQLDINAENYSKYLQDGVHPNMAGSQMYVELVAAKIKGMAE